MKIYYGYADNSECIYEVYTMDCEDDADGSERYSIDAEIYDDRQGRGIAFSIHKSSFDKVECMSEDFGIYEIYSLNQDIVYQEIENIKKQNKISLQEKLREVEKPIVSFDRTT